MKNFTWKPRRSLLALAILSATGTAIAEQKTHHLSIAPQSISDALKALAAETHIQIFSDGEALKGKKTNGIQGDFTSKEALQKLLTGTGLTFTLTADDAFAVKAVENRSQADQIYETPVVEVVSSKSTSLITPSTEVATAQINRIPGGVEVVSDMEYKNGVANTIKDALDYVPGVFTSGARYAGDGRISIRGSGLAKPYGNRGVNMYMDSMPVNTADGILDVLEVDPTAYRYIEVYKGANAMRFGGNSLGGAINLVTPTGRDSSPFEVRVDAGSFGYQKAQSSFGGVKGNFDYYVTGSEETFDGYRDHTKGDQQRGSGNFGYKFSDDVETRFYVNANRIRLQMAGELTKAQALNSPTMANSDFAGKNQQRNIDSVTVANKTTFLFGPSKLEFGAYGKYKDLDHPNYQYLAYDQTDYGGFARVTDDRLIGGFRNILVTGVNFVNGTGDSNYYHYLNSWSQFYEATPNPPGAIKGGLATSYIDNSENTTAYIDDSIYILKDVAIGLGFQFQHVGRSRNNRLGGDQSNRFTSGTVSFDNFSPKFGVLWDINKDAQVFANISQSAEAPSFSENSFRVGAPTLKVQTATTYEIGTRGRNKGFIWDLSLYRANVQNELQCLSTGIIPGASCTSTNVGNTIHQGIEAGISS